jgi:hypothetical protein
MQKRIVRAAFIALGLVTACCERAMAQCTLPYQLTNGQAADATQVMANYNALVACLSNAAPAGANNALQYNAGSGAFGAVGPLTNGQLVIGSTGVAPQAQTLTPGAGIVITNGPGSITISTASGTGNGLYGPVMSGIPTAASTGLVNWLNQGSATSTNSAVGLSINFPANASPGGLFVAAPSAPYTITALIAATRNSTGYNGVGIGWYDGSAKLHLISYVTQNGNAPYFEVEKWNSVSSFNGNDLTSASNAFSQAPPGRRWHKCLLRIQPGRRQFSYPVLDGQIVRLPRHDRLQQHHFLRQPDRQSDDRDTHVLRAKLVREDQDGQGSEEWAC